jgi:hypothetical protein
MVTKPDELNGIGDHPQIELELDDNDDGGEDGPAETPGSGPFTFFSSSI